MRIALTYENNETFQHFGHTKQFKFYDIENNKIQLSKVVDTNGNSHGALVGFLVANQADVILCGGIGKGTKDALTSDNIYCLEE